MIDAGTRTKLSWGLWTRRLWRDAGLPGVVGIALLSAAVLLWAWVVPQVRQQNLALAAQTRHTLAELSRPVTVVATTQDVLGDFYARLEPVAQRSAVLATLLQQAQAQGLSIATLQLRMDDRPHSAVQRQIVAVPLQGGYAQLRAWLADVSAQDAALSIDDMDVHRDGAQTEQVQARVTLSLWLRTPARSLDARGHVKALARVGETAGAASGSTANPTARNAMAIAGDLAQGVSPSASSAHRWE